MSGFDQWLSSSLHSVAGGSSLPVWAAGAFAALLFFVGILAFARAAQLGRAGVPWRVALLLVGAGLMWVLVDSLGGRDRSATRRVLDARAVELTLRAIAPGSPLACLDTVANETLGAACEKLLFANSQTVAAAVAYVDARLSLLADSLELAARDRGYEASIERLRRSLEADRFGMVGHVLATRGCTEEDCAALKLFRNPKQVVTNLRERSFDANVIVHAAAWNAPAPVAAAPAAPALAAAPHVATTGASPPSGKFDFPSSASIPAISIMSAEPPLAPGESSNVPSPPASATSAAPAAKPPAQRRQSARETPPAQQPPQQQGAPPAPVPLPPPGTMANPR